MTLTWGEQPTQPPILRRMQVEDAAAAYALSTHVGWGINEADWVRYILWAGDGAFCIAQGEQIVATTFTIGYGQDRAWVGGVITHPDYQRKGYAARIMQSAMGHLQDRGVRHIMLDATAEGRALYEKLGFRVLYNIEIWRGRASSYLGARARPMRPVDLPEVIALDAIIFGVPRARIIRRLLTEFPHRAWVDEDPGGTLTGFIMAQPRAALTHIGPWAATTPWSAEKLLRTALSVLIGEEVRVDIADRNTRAAAFAHGFGLHYTHHCVRMIHGKAHPPIQNIHQYYGMAAMATG